MSSNPENKNFLRRILPKRLFYRSLLIVATPILLLQGALAYVFMERHRTVTTHRLSAAAAGEIAALVALAENPARQALLVDMADQFKVQLSREASLPSAERLRPALLYHALKDELATRLDERETRLALASDGKRVKIFTRLQSASGESNPVLAVDLPLNRVYATNSHIFIVWMAGISLLLLVIAILFLRGQTRPIQRLARAAHELGQGRELTDFTPSGAKEIREAGEAFLLMQERVQRYVVQRTQMLAGVSHDLRTPLTRFGLQLALLPQNEQTQEMRRDLDEMTRMLEDYLNFARGQQAEPMRMLDLAELVREAADHAKTHARLSLPPSLKLHGRRNTLLRCLMNLVGNAKAHGTEIHITGASDGRYVGIDIDDDGPGIPPEKYEEVFRPFYRLDDARNQDHGGTGLGLAIARDAARAHGGDITLSRSPAGGLRARLVLPV